MTCVKEVLRTRIIPNRSAFVICEVLGDLGTSRSVILNNNTTITLNSSSTNNSNINTLPSVVEGGLLLGDDEILQIKILYGGKCVGVCFRVQTIHHNNNNTTTTPN